GRLRSRALGGLRLGPQRVRRGLRRAWVFLRQRAAAVRGQALRAARRAATVRDHGPMGVSLMRTAVEISLYPLDADYIPAIKLFIDRLNTYPELQVTTNAMSTQIAGEHARVFEILGKETALTFGERGRKVFVMKVLGGTG